MTGFVNVFIVALFLIGGFLLFRNILCWYWKLNEIIVILKGILAELEKHGHFMNQWDVPWIPQEKK